MKEPIEIPSTWQYMVSLKLKETDLVANSHTLSLGKDESISLPPKPIYGQFGRRDSFAFLYSTNLEEKKL